MKSEFCSRQMFRRRTVVVRDGVGREVRTAPAGERKLAGAWAQLEVCRRLACGYTGHGHYLQGGTQLRPRAFFAMSGGGEGAAEVEMKHLYNTARTSAGETRV